MSCEKRNALCGKRTHREHRAKPISIFGRIEILPSYYITKGSVCQYEYYKSWTNVPCKYR